MAYIGRPSRIGVIRDGVLTENGNPFNLEHRLKYRVLPAAPDRALEDVITPNYVVGSTLYRTGLIAEEDGSARGYAWLATPAAPTRAWSRTGG